MNTLEPGCRFGKYRILEIIGHGGMGIVYVAEDTTLERCVALKVLSPELVSSGAFEERFRREARIVASLNHPNIVQIHSLEDIHGKLVIDMTYVEGGSLAQAEASRSASLGQTLRSVRDVLNGLASCHQVGVVHRDVKPNNILLDLHGNALLSDFGLSKCLAARHEAAMGSMASSCLFMGTPRYAPPESWEVKEPTPAWDVYSAGAVIYEAVAGRAPHEANSPLELIRSFYENAVPPLHDLTDTVTPVFSNAVCEMLASKPEERPQNASEALERLSSTPEFSKQPPAKCSTIVQVKWPPKSTAKPFRVARINRPALVVTALAAVVVLASLLAFGIWLSGSPGGDMLARPPANHYVFNTTNTLTGERWPEHWLMTRGPDHETWHILASKGTDLIYLEGTPDDDALAFRGHWAHYTDRTARAFRHGTARGTGTWIRDNELATVSLQFECTQDGSRWQNAFLLDRTASDIPPGRFVTAIESSALFFRLVYCELMPRNLGWAEEIETQFMVPGITRARIPFVRASDGPMHINGQATEAVWRRAAANPNPEFGVLEAHPEGSNTNLTICHDEHHVYLRCASGVAMSRPVLTLHILTQFDADPGQLPSWKLVADKDAAVRLSKVIQGREYPQNNVVKAAVHSNGPLYEIEMRLPFKALELEKAPVPGTRWRVSATLADAEDEANQTVLYWGRTAGALPTHGEILIFGPSP